ncbi:hypothetical protein BDF14DRAFT_530356 [Spinellus fusiger]|nr:hypothetical protein BDF14DRAFT_530356 [Spinellus fusiger]
MAFSSMAGGADCGPSNPMSGLMKQFQQDRSLQQDRLSNNSQGESLMSGFRTRSAQPSFAERQFAEEFIQEERISDRPGGIFEFNGLKRELGNIHASPQPHASQWTDDFMQQPMFHPPETDFEAMEAIYKQHGPGIPWQQEFSVFQHSPSEAMATTHQEVEAFERAFEEINQANTGQWEKEWTAQTSWAEEFKEATASDTTMTATTEQDKEALARTAAMLLDSVHSEENPKFKNSNFMNLMRKLRDKEVSIEGNSMVESKGKEAWTSEFESIHGESSGMETNRMASGGGWASEFTAHPPTNWATEFEQKQDLSATGTTTDWATEFEQRQDPTTADTIDWAAEFSKYGPMDPSVLQKVLPKDEEGSEWVRMYQESIGQLDAKTNEWEDMQSSWDKATVGQLQPSRLSFSDKDYVFSLNNPYLMNPSLIDGTEHHSLSDSIMALEAKVQLSPSDAMSWSLLGLQQQENERDTAAIAALQKAVSLNPSLHDAWLALAVSYTNEGCRLDTYHCLEQWIYSNDNYNQRIQRRPASENIDERHVQLTELFLEAARSSPHEEMDPDVQVSLGVLFNISEEYPKAIDCFKAALQSRPQDYLLWNKLGATLANSRNSSGAIDAYFNALEINPSFVRARYNLAISCINLRQHREAAEHLLTALSLQHYGQSTAPLTNNTLPENTSGYLSSGMSDNVWDNLRMLMFMMNRNDLATHCDQRNLDAFRGVFEF